MIGSWLRRERPTPATPVEADGDLRCPACRAEIEPAAAAPVCLSCPLHRLSEGCRLDLIACPRCGYHSLPAEQPPATGSDPITEPSAPVIRTPPLPAGAGAPCPMSELPSGTRARVVGLERLGDSDLRRLIAYGLMPGVDVELLQRFPAYVVRLYRTELALATSLAEMIRVVPLDAAGEAG